MRIAPESAAAVDAPSRPLLAVEAIGARVDGPFTARLAALQAPYADAPTDGYLNLSAAALNQAADIADARGVALHLHAQGDRAVALALDAIGRTDRPGMLIGADLPPAGWLQQVLANEITVAIVPLRFSRDIYWLEQRLGEERSETAHRWRDMVAAGARWAIASDAPAYPLSPFDGILALTTRQNVEGYPASGWYPDQAVGPLLSLRATVGPRGLASEPVLSSGSPADLVVWSENPLAPDANDETLQRAEVLLTIVAGRVVYSRPLVDLPMNRDNGDGP
jgi:hypothetical protein